MPVPQKKKEARKRKATKLKARKGEDRRKIR
jgi:hypothetical protein